MPILVHLTPTSLVTRLRRVGIRQSRARVDGRPAGVYAVPVSRNYVVSHQWLRELARRNRGPITAVHFRIPDAEPVWVGHYAASHERMTAAEAAALFRQADDRLGWECIVPRRIEAREIHAVRAVRQVLGWRYYPGANGAPPFCTCAFCTPGQYGAAKLRARTSGGP